MSKCLSLAGRFMADRGGEPFVNLSSEEHLSRDAQRTIRQIVRSQSPEGPPAKEVVPGWTAEDILRHAG